MFEFFEMPHFSQFQNSEPKMKVFDFGAFQNKMHMTSREKYIFHMLFGAFHDTPRKMILNSNQFPGNWT